MNVITFIINKIYICIGNPLEGHCFSCGIEFEEGYQDIECCGCSFEAQDMWEFKEKLFASKEYKQGLEKAKGTVYEDVGYYEYI